MNLRPMQRQVLEMKLETLKRSVDVWRSRGVEPTGKLEQIANIQKQLDDDMAQKLGRVA